ncbi:MAG: amidohydrolase family protein [Bacteroidales bacterium]
MKKIDAHLHINLNGLTPDKLIKYLDSNNIEACWVLTWEEDNPQIAKNYKHLSIEQILDLYDKHPDRIIPFYAPPPSENPGKLDDIFTEYIKKGIRGCGELKVSHLWQDTIIDSYLSVLQKFNLPLLFHMEAPRFFIPPQDIIASKAENATIKAVKNILNFLPQKILQKYSEFFNRNFNKTFFKGYLYDFMGLEKMLVSYPNQIFIAHGPHFWNNISANIKTRNRYSKGRIRKFGVIDRLLEEYPNLYCDISGGSGFNALSRDFDGAAYFLNKHHQKILFGTDNYSGLQHEKLLSSINLPLEKKKNIYYKNAEKILH